jgi:hypothetical protein
MKYLEYIGSTLRYLPLRYEIKVSHANTTPGAQNLVSQSHNKQVSRVLSQELCVTQESNIERNQECDTRLSFDARQPPIRSFFDFSPHLKTT